MFDGASDLDLSALENGGFPADFQRHFFLLTLLDEILMDCLDLGHIGSRSLRRRCRRHFFAFRLVFFGAGLAEIARLRFGWPGRRIAVVGRLGEYLAEGQNLLARHFAYFETSFAGR